MNWKQLAIRIITAGAALGTPARLAWGQTCNCEGTSTVPGRTMAARVPQPVESGLSLNASRRLPAGWPSQWSEPAVSTDSQKTTAGTPGATESKGIAETLVRDPFTGKMVPTTAQARWDRAITTSIETTNQNRPSTGPAIGTSPQSAPATGTSHSRQSDQKSSPKSYSILPSRSGAAAGGAIGGGIGGDIGGGVGGASGGIGSGIGGSSGGGGFNWSPRSGSSGSGGSGGGSSNRSNSGTLGYLANSEHKSDPTSSGNATNAGIIQTGPGSGNSTNSSSAGSGNGSGSSSSGSGFSVIADPGKDVLVVCAPDTLIPDYAPEIPTDDNSAPGGASVPGISGADTPIVPEPGSIILLGIAGATAAAVLIRRRCKNLRSAANA